MKTEIQKMRDRIRFLERENRELKTHISMYNWEQRDTNKDLIRMKDIIIDTVCNHFETDMKTISGIDRHRDHIAARFLLCYLLYKDALLTLKEIGAILGGRDHTTVLHAIQETKQRISGNLGYREYFDYQTIKPKLDEFIEQVETAH